MKAILQRWFHLATRERGPDRFYINKQDRKEYEELLRDKNSPFKEKENKDVFIMAMATGFAEGVRIELGKKEGFFRAEYLQPRERALIAAVAVAEKGNLGVLIDKKEAYAIAEAYAAGGIRLLKDKVFGGEYGSYAKKLEQELLAGYEKASEREPKKSRSGEETGAVSIANLIRNGENSKVEFKSSLIWDYKQERPNKLISMVVARTVSCFMNSDGGVVLLGVDNEGKIIGLDKDLAQLDGSLDNFELHFTNTINTCLGKINRPQASISFERISGKHVAVIEVRKAQRPVYIKNEGKTEFFIRSGNSCQPLDISEANTYTKDHWPNLT